VTVDLGASAITRHRATDNAFVMAAPSLAGGCYHDGSVLTLVAGSGCCLLLQPNSCSEIVGAFTAKASVGIYRRLEALIRRDWQSGSSRLPQI